MRAIYTDKTSNRPVELSIEANVGQTVSYRKIGGNGRLVTLSRPEFDARFAASSSGAAAAAASSGFDPTAGAPRAAAPISGDIGAKLDTIIEGLAHIGARVDEIYLVAMPKAEAPAAAAPAADENHPSGKPHKRD